MSEAIGVTAGSANRTYLGGVRVVELADEQGEFCGRLLASLGADVIKVEPPGGSATRRIGPFAGDEPGPDRSLYFWHYNLGKRSVVMDLESEAGRADFRALARTADVLLESCPVGYLEERSLGYNDLAAGHPELVYASITPFGPTGPWAGYLGSDLVHLALGGQMTYCGYQPGIDGEYDTPPIAGQMWQAYQMAGDNMAIGVLGALLSRRRTGVGQRVDVSVHQVAACNTELDVLHWIYARKPMLGTRPDPPLDDQGRTIPVHPLRRPDERLHQRGRAAREARSGVRPGRREVPKPGLPGASRRWLAHPVGHRPFCRPVQVSGSLGGGPGGRGALGPDAPAGGEHRRSALAGPADLRRSAPPGAGAQPPVPGRQVVQPTGRLGRGVPPARGWRAFA